MITQCLAAASAAHALPPRARSRRLAQVCSLVNIDGLRGDIVINRASRALAAFEGRTQARDTFGKTDFHTSLAWPGLAACVAAVALLARYHAASLACSP